MDRSPFFSLQPDADDLPEAINVATSVKHVNRELPGFDEAYNLLSEFSHPNWLGVVGLYLKHDAENFRTEFGRGLHGQRGSRLAHALALGLATFEIGYHRAHALCERASDLLITTQRRFSLRVWGGDIQPSSRNERLWNPFEWTRGSCHCAYVVNAHQ
jgi:hypothetical protein